MSRKLIFVIVFLLLPLSGCGIVSVGYNYADAYLRYSINSYTSFNSGQKKIIHDEVDIYMRWHRKEMLPDYVSFLHGLRNSAQAGAALKQQDVAGFRRELHMLYVGTLQPAIKPAAHLLSGMTPGQIEELAKSLQYENRQRRAKELSGSQDTQLRKRAEKTVDFIESLVGGLSDRQLDVIREMNHKSPFATALYFQMREDNQARLIELLRNKKGAGAIGDFLLLWLTAPEAGRSAEEQATLRAYEHATDEMIVKVYAMLTERQRKTLLKNIMKYADTFQKLSKPQ